jgi:hypothetical protein
MEAVVFDDSPLAEYLEGVSWLHAFTHELTDFSAGEGGDYPHGLSSLEPEPSSTSPSPSFAPRGRPTVRSKYRQRLPPPIRLAIPQNNTVAAIHDTCSVGPINLLDLYRQLTTCWDRGSLIRDWAAPTMRDS